METLNYQMKSKQPPNDDTVGPAACLKEAGGIV